MHKKSDCGGGVSSVGLYAVIQCFLLLLSDENLTCPFSVFPCSDNEPTEGIERTPSGRGLVRQQRLLYLLLFVESVYILRKPLGGTFPFQHVQPQHH